MNGLSRLSKISQRVIVFLKPEFFKNCRRYFKRIYVKLVLCKNQFLLFIKCFGVTAEYPATLYHHCFRWSAFFEERSITQ